MKISTLLVLAGLAVMVENGWGCGESQALLKYHSQKGRIVKGDNVDDCSEIPWQAGLVIDGKYMCGGSIIGPKHILTAAHCIHKRENLPIDVYVGNTTWMFGQKHKVKNVIKHENFNLLTKDSDVAILELTTAITFSTCAQPICLKKDVSFDQQYCIASGWGRTSWNGQMSFILQKVKLQAHDGPHCESRYGLAPNSYIKNTATMMCAALPGKDACQGDSGGPLVCKNGNSFVQVGVVSYAKECALAKYPGVYANVPYFIEWIEQNTDIKFL